MTTHKFTELQDYMKTTEKRFSTLVSKVLTKTDRIEAAINRQISYHSDNLLQQPKISVLDEDEMEESEASMTMDAAEEDL